MLFRSLRLLPVNAKIIQEMIAETRLASLFAGPRGSVAVDVQAFITSVLRIAEVAAGWPDGSELDINPITVLPTGAWVLDSAYAISGIINEAESN